MTSPGTGMTRGCWSAGMSALATMPMSEAAAGTSARTRPAAISPIRLSGSRTVVSGG